MTKEEFQELLRRYRAGECSAEERIRIDRWFNDIASEENKITGHERTEINDRILSSLQNHLRSPRTGTQPIRGLLFLKIAASLLAITVVIALVINRDVFDPTGDSFITWQTQPILHKNTTEKLLYIDLPDSSKVSLHPGSEISYAPVWIQEREVHLVGEAFFEVVKDSRRPFFVHGGEVVTKVLGTSFSVNASPHAKSIKVAVRTGKVSVYEESASPLPGSPSSGVVLTPNEKVEFFVEDRHWVTSLVAEPQPAPGSNKAVEFVFNNTRLADIIHSIETTYSIDVVTENEPSADCTFTGDVSMMELYDMLDVICKSTGTRYEVKGTKILLTGRGCE
jgi:transmembrane sensor